MNWKLTLTYDGTPYNGWQIQPHLPTIQGSLAAALHQLTGESVLPQGSGRTDSGVHALAQVTSFHLTGPIPAANLLRALNHTLPASIRVLTADPAPDTFHARHSARAKTYEYRIFQRQVPRESGVPRVPLLGPGFSEPTEPQSSTLYPPEQICPPFLAPYVWDCRWPLDLTAMQLAATHFLGTHNFLSFAASDPDTTHRAMNQLPEPKTQNPSPGPNPIKTITESILTQENNLLIYRITGSGFLHHMVRNIVGTLAEVGRAALSPNDIPTILAAKSRPTAGPTAPASGLYLHTVHYDPQNPEPKTQNPLS